MFISITQSADAEQQQIIRGQGKSKFCNILTKKVQLEEIVCVLNKPESNSQEIKKAGETLLSHYAVDA